MYALLRRLLLPLLRRNPREIQRAVATFRIEQAESRQRVVALGQAFLGGYNAMLAARDLAEVTREGRRTAVHYRPFFFEGAAMGYLPRSYFTRGAGPETLEHDVLHLDPVFRYLYYVGFGFWFGFRHAARPAQLERLAPWVDPLYFPLCYDGFGFKLGFFDHTRRELEPALSLTPASRRRFLVQGYGRSMFFVHMDDPAGFDARKSRIDERYRDDLECGRSLAWAFTGIDRPEAILGYLEAARDRAELAARLTGVTWALTARRMNDPRYFEECLAPCPAAPRAFLAGLPELCDAARRTARGYADWQARTRDAALERYAAGPGRRAGREAG